MPDRDIGPEEEYFAKEDLEKLKKIRAQQDEQRRKQAEEQRRQAHWMKCPKCGSDLKETIAREVAVDVCGNCGGVWLDAGELEMLLNSKETALGRFFKMLKLELDGPVNDAPGGLEKK